jgi:hypothetical protein
MPLRNGISVTRLQCVIVQRIDTSAASLHIFKVLSVGIKIQSSIRNCYVITLSVISSEHYRYRGVSGKLSVKVTPCRKQFTLSCKKTPYIIT